MPKSFDPDRNLLFGILALQMDFINRDGLIGAMNAWVLDKKKSLGEIMVGQGRLSRKHQELLEAMVQAHVLAHQNDAKQSLAAVSTGMSLPRELSVIEDEEVQESLAAADSAFGHAEKTVTDSPAGGPRYRILRPHAKGGLGEVFVAEDRELHREVALKEIQGKHAHNPVSCARFQLEAEITGRLEHPGVVPVYGLGKHEDGRPYYVMRFIKGDNLREAIKRFHDADVAGRNPGERRLEFRKLLRRFIDVCNAVAYAHSRGILHRDLKPGNIMLGKYGETLVVDWGLAKVAGRQAAVSESERSVELTLHPYSGSGSLETQAGAALGTPAFISPEQAAGKLDELGPASDIYGLGATLYVLLTGKLPFSGEAVGAILAMVQLGEFRPPRQVHPTTPAPLDAICRKAMALRPADRYATALDVAADIEHWLADEPVAAYPEPWHARGRRWLRHHRTLATSAAAALVIAVVALGGATVLLNAARASEHQARLDEADQRRHAQNARAEMERSQKQAQAVASFLVETFRSPDPERDGRDIKVTEILDRAVDQIESGDRQDPVIKAQLLRALGETYYGLGLPAKAVTLNEKARDLFEQHMGSDHLETFTLLNNLAMSYHHSRRSGDAISLLEDIVPTMKAKHGPYHTDTLGAINNLALVYQDEDRPADALSLLESTMRIVEEQLGADHPDALTVANNLARAYLAVGRREDAITLFEQTFRARQTKLGRDHPHTLNSMDNLAEAYRAAGRFNDALTLHEQSHRLRKAKLGADHPETLTSVGNLALSYSNAGRLSDAVRFFEEALSLQTAKRGADHPRTLLAMSNLAKAYGDMGRTDKALPLLEKALPLMQSTHGPDHPHTVACLSNLAVAYSSDGRVDDAVKLHEEVLRLRKAKLGADNPQTLSAMNNLGVAYRDAGRLPDALNLHEETLRLRKEVLKPEHPATLRSMHNLARAYQDTGRLADALTLYKTTLALQKKRPGPDHVDTLSTMHLFASALKEAGKIDQALAMFQDSLAGRRKALPADSPAIAATLAGLGQCLSDQGKLAEAEPLLRECLALREKKRPDHFEKSVAESLLGELLARQKKYADAEPLLLRGYEGLAPHEKKLPFPAERERAAALGRLIRLYEDWGQPEKAAQWRAKREKEGH
jgi:serine/threonine protein kinase